MRCRRWRGVFPGCWGRPFPALSHFEFKNFLKMPVHHCKNSQTEEMNQQATGQGRPGS
jgi:hypothetical protein